MSNSITPIDLYTLATVTGGGSQAHSRASDDLLNTLNSLSGTLQKIGSASKSSGFSTTEILMLGLMLNQSRNQVVFVRRPYW